MAREWGNSCESGTARMVGVGGTRHGSAGGERVPRGLVAAAAAVALVVASACGPGPESAPVDVEGTVQARVSATLAAARTAPTPTRPAAVGASPAAATAVGASPAAGTAAAAASAARSGTPGAGGTPAANTTPGAGTTPGPGTLAAQTASAGAATAARSATPAGTVQPGAAAGATVQGTVPVPLSLGNYARLGGLMTTIARYEWGYSCPSGSGRPASGTKFVTLYVAARNDGATALTLPSMQWAVEGHSPVSPARMPCQPDDQSLSSTCFRTSQLTAGARCEGWLLFEVPEVLDVPGAQVLARAASDVVAWRLPA